jgi:acyl carrier protein
MRYEYQEIYGEDQKKMINDNKDEKSRLVDCFSAVFPALNREQIARADQSTLSEWDSMATVTLISVIEDEFHVEIPATEMEKLFSFEGFLKVLTDATVNSASK